MINLHNIPLAFFVAQALALPDRQNQSNCCAALQAQLSEKVLVRGTDNITAAIEPYWSAQAQEQRPACVVLPSTAAEVSTAVRILSSGFEKGLGYCEFAIRSGGHTPAGGINNIDDGVTIDLSNLNVVELSCDGATVAVGPGNRWEDVYTLLDPMNLTVVGGRSRTVGVGGLLLSGGMSFFSPRYGMPCDNVINYEVVLSDGSIVNANASSHPDLYKALKGGSNNFGVVTRFDLRAISQGPFWGGMAFYNASSLPTLISYFSHFAHDDGYDPYSQLTLLYGMYVNTTIVMTHQHYTKHEAPPETVFGDFSPLQTQKTFRIDTLKNFTIELESKPDGGTIRKAFATATYANNVEMLQRFSDLATATMDSVRSVPGLQFIVSMQPFGQFITSRAAATGGNFLGLDVDDGERVLIGLTLSWTYDADDETIDEAIRFLIEEAGVQANELEAEDDFVFMNYAALWQDVYAGVGETNREEFRKVSKMYDQPQIFQRGVPGGFKL
ncbi:FAD binding domain-containing protein [Halenospora varia]|nr:FAD binding domain-containing protein [Halenospora varia]